MPAARTAEAGVLRTAKFAEQAVVGVPVATDGLFDERC